MKSSRKRNLIKFERHCTQHRQLCHQPSGTNSLLFLSLATSTHPTTGDKIITSGSKTQTRWTKAQVDLPTDSPAKHTHYLCRRIQHKWERRQHCGCTRMFLCRTQKLHTYDSILTTWLPDRMTELLVLNRITEPELPKSAAKGNIIYLFIYGVICNVIVISVCNSAGKSTARINRRNEQIEVTGVQLKCDGIWLLYPLRTQ